MKTMKKLITIVLVIVMVATMGLQVSAASVKERILQDMDQWTFIDQHPKDDDHDERMLLDPKSQTLFALTVGHDGSIPGSFVAIPCELDRLGVYKQVYDDRNFVVWVADNPGAEYGKEVIRVCQYDTKWGLIASASVVTSQDFMITHIDLAYISQYTGLHIVYDDGNEYGYDLYIQEPKYAVFEDVNNNAYYAKPVQWAYQNNITNGTDGKHFSPDKPCTRGEIVTLMWRLAGCPLPSLYDWRFVDITESGYYGLAAMWAAQSGITNGTAKTHFSPDAVCTRAQIVSMLHRFNGTVPAESTNFADVNPNSYYADAVDWAVSRGVTNGKTSTEFAPNDPCTRAEAVTFLFRSPTVWRLKWIHAMF